MAARRGPRRDRTSRISRRVGPMYAQAPCWTPRRNASAANLQVLTGCSSLLGDDGQSRLGSPNSESPEFWRAAPDAAVEWSV